MEKKNHESLQTINRMLNDKTRKFFAVILLALLIIVPFIDWRLGAVMWMCAWLVFIFQKLFSRQTWNLGDNEEKEEEEEYDDEDTPD
jgi:4-hydroxybenzoate polyprenyltransferase